jgi:hypothetical protein
LTNSIAVCKCAVQLGVSVLGIVGGGGMEKLTRGVYVEVSDVEVNERGDAEVWDDEVSVEEREEVKCDIKCEEEVCAVEVDEWGDIVVVDGVTVWKPDEGVVSVKPT